MVEEGSTAPEDGRRRLRNARGGRPDGGRRQQVPGRQRQAAGHADHQRAPTDRRHCATLAVGPVRMLDRHQPGRPPWKGRGVPVDLNQPARVMRAARRAGPPSHRLRHLAPGRHRRVRERPLSERRCRPRDATPRVRETGRQEGLGRGKARRVKRGCSRRRRALTFRVGPRRFAKLARDDAPCRGRVALGLLLRSRCCGSALARATRGPRDGLRRGTVSRLHRLGTRGRYLRCRFVGYRQ